MKIRLPRRWALAVVTVLLGFVVVPVVVGSTSPAAAAPCDLSGQLAPEVIGSGVDGMIKPPEPEGGQAPVVTNYGQFGMAGQFWHTHELGCSDIAAVLGNSWANTIFLWAKAIDRLTITTYQAAATEGPLQAIKDVVDDIVTNLSQAMYWPYLQPIVILGAIWLAWYGLIRKRATTTAEGVIWMVLAVTVATWFLSRPQDFTGLGAVVTDKTGEVVNSAFSGLPGAGGTSCLPPPGETNPEVRAGGYGQNGTPGVEQNADALWSTLVCKPWLMGMFGTADPDQPIVRDFGRVMLETQSIAPATAENPAPDVGAHQAQYAEIADKLRNDSRYFIFSGRDWTSRLGVAIGALIAAMVAGVLIFLVAVSLLVLKVGFLLLLILGPVFLLIGVHPGSGRIIAMRWVEMLIGTLLRQAVLALVLGVLVYGYALIISTAMPWGLQILFMALLTIAVFFYRRPFQHLFSSINGHTLATRMLGEAASSPTLERAANVLPPVASARIGRWGVRKAEPLLTAAVSGGAAGAAASGVAQGRVRGEESEGASGVRVPAPLDKEQQGVKAGGRRVPEARKGDAPPLNLGGTNSRGGTVRPGGGVRAAGGPRGLGAGAGGPRSSGSGSGSSGSSGSSGASAASGGSGGWFGGRPSGWAPRGGTSSGGRRSRFGGSGGSGSSGGRSGGGSGGSLFGRGSGSGGSLFGGSNGSRSGGSRPGPARSRFGGGARSSRDNGSSGGVFGRNPDGRVFGGSSSGGGFFDSDRRGSEPPPLWGSSSRGSEPAVPFWLNPTNPDKD